MPNPRYTLALVAGLVGLASATAAQEADPLVDLIRASTHAIDAVDGTFAGPGAEFLLDAAAEAEFTVIGERHGTRETPALTSWLLRELSDHGYTAYAVEVGPHSAQVLTELARAADPIAAFDQFTAANPFTVPFFWWKEEAQTIVDAVDRGYAVWGLDQEFIGSGRIHLARLRELAPDDDARALIEDWWQKEMVGLAHYQQTQSTERAIFYTMTAEGAAELREAFDGVDEAQTIVNEILASARVYQLYGAGANYQSNYERIRLMKSHFNDYLRAPGGPEPTGGGKVLLKFGSMHGGRGHSALHQLDVGNQAAELAALRGGDSLNVLVLGRNFTPAGGEPTDTTGQQPGLAKLFAATAALDWSVVDLRALRPLLHTERGQAGNETLATTVWAYDVAVVVDTFHAAEDLGS